MYIVRVVGWYGTQTWQGIVASWLPLWLAIEWVGILATGTRLYHLRTWTIKMWESILCLNFLTRSQWASGLLWTAPHQLVWGRLRGCREAFLHRKSACANEKRFITSWRFVAKVLFQRTWEAWRGTPAATRRSATRGSEWGGREGGHLTTRSIGLLGSCNGGFVVGILLPLLEFSGLC